MAKFNLFGHDNMAAVDTVAVIGLGRFGSALALELMATGVDVLGVDEREDIVQKHNGRLSSVIQADTTSEEALRQIAVNEFERVVVGIGTDIEASILTVSLLIRMGVREIWAKAVSDQHGEILKQLGVHHVVFPEKDMARRVAHLVRGRMQDYIEIGQDFALVTTNPHPESIGKTLREANIRQKYKVTITAYQRGDAPWTYTDADTVLQANDTILVTGKTRRVEAFSHHIHADD